MEDEQTREVYDSSQQYLQFARLKLEQFSSYQLLGERLQEHVKDKDVGQLNRINSSLEFLMNQLLNEIKFFDEIATLLERRLKEEYVPESEFEEIVERYPSMPLTGGQRVRLTRKSEMQEARNSQLLQKHGISEHSANTFAMNQGEVVFAYYDHLKKRYLPED